MITVLFAETNGVYCGLHGIDVWGVERDARRYNGPGPVIAHPPCERWGRYWSGGPSAKVRRKKGDDGGCFKHAVYTVRRVGGVIEHPEASHAWAAFGIDRPPKSGGWVLSQCGGWTCCVEQGHYGHPARKATWLYFVGPRPPDLIWGPSQGTRLECGFHSRAERDAARARGIKPLKRISKRQMIDTPLPFRDLLIKLVSR